MGVLWEVLVVEELRSNATVHLLQFAFGHVVNVDVVLVAIDFVVLVALVVMAFHQLPEVHEDSTVARMPDCCSRLGDLVVVDCWYGNSSAIESHENKR